MNATFLFVCVFGESGIYVLYIVAVTYLTKPISASCLLGLFKRFIAEIH